MQVVQRIEGDVQLQATLAGMDRRMRSGIMGKALREASKPLIKEARAQLVRNATIRTWGLYKSVGVKIKTYRNSGNTIAIVGPRYPQGSHGHLVERGTKPRWSGGPASLIVGPSRTGSRKAKRFSLRPTKRHYHGIMPAFPFMLPAFYATWRESLTIVRRRAWEEIRKSVRVAGAAAA